MKRVCSWVVLGVLLVLGGCGKGDGDGPPLVPVTGTVTLDKEPLAGAVVTFIPTGTTRGLESSGRTGKDGKYTLATPRGREGVTVGTHKVTISRYVLPGGAEYKPDPNVGLMDSPARESLAAMYSDPEKSTLTRTVPEGGGTIDFPLKGKSQR